MLKTILLLNPVYVTLFWALVLNLHDSKKHVPKVFLGKFMLVAHVLYLSHFFYFSGRYEIYYFLDSIYTLSSLLVYPLYHIYVRLLTTDTKFSLKIHGIYLVLPFVIFILHLSAFILIDKTTAMHYLTIVIRGQAQGQGLAKYLEIIYFLFRIVFIFQAILYLYLNYRLISDHNARLDDYYSNVEEMRLNWVQFFNISLAVTSVASVTVALMGRDIFSNGETSLIFPSLLFSSMLFIIGFLGNIQQEVKIAPEPIEPVPIRLKEPRPGKLNEKMKALFENEMIYKNPDLKIWDLCNMLGTNRTYVSRMINREYNRNFCNHVNYYRLQHAKKLILADNNHTNEEIADLSGFGSVNSLYRAFQTFEEKSLGEYRKNPAERLDTRSPV
jgi:AraC-like DNA-binding protein